MNTNQPHTSQANPLSSWPAWLLTGSYRTASVSLSQAAGNLTVYVPPQTSANCVLHMHAVASPRAVWILSRGTRDSASGKKGLLA